MTKRRVTRTAVCAALLSLSTGCIAPREVEETPVEGLTRCAVRVPGDQYIATIFPYEGPWPVGTSLEAALIQALDQINEQGGVGPEGRPLGAVVCNDKGDADTARQSVDELLQLQPEVLAVIGPVHNEPVLAATKEVVRLTGSVGGVVLASPVVNAPAAVQIIDDRGNLFRYAPSIEAEVRAAIQVAAVATSDRVLVLSAQDQDSSTFANALGNELEAQGYVVTSAVFDPNQVDFAAAALVEAQVYQPDSVFLIGFPGDVSGILRSAAEAEFAPRKNWVLPSWAKRSELFTLVGRDDYLENHVVGVGPAFTERTSHIAFSNEYENQWATLPETYAAHVYDAVYSVAMAVHLAGGGATRADVKAKLVERFGGSGGGVEINPGQWAKFRGVGGERASYVGATGAMLLDADGNRSLDVETWRIQRGQFRTGACVGADGDECE
jgi:ABC-type branched-subunit amino acid transport system substrate-binding protein